MSHADRQRRHDQDRPDQDRPDRDRSDPVLPERDPHGHKGTFGTVVVVGGCAAARGQHMAGAPALVALGALRSGAGLAKLVCPEPVLPTAISIAPSATGIALPTDGAGTIVPHQAAALLDGLLESVDALAIGPGLGGGADASDEAQHAVESVCLRAIQQDRTPVVVDADALNALARVPDLARECRAPAVFTPHPGEFRRLAETLRIIQSPTEPGERRGAAETMAQRLGCVVVLKGAETVVSDGQRTWTCTRGHACLGTGGTGDVLTGVIAGLIAQFVRPADPLLAKLPERARKALGGGDGDDGKLDLFEAARAGVLAHAIAGERWAEQRGASGGLLAAELTDLLPACVESLRA